MLAVFGLTAASGCKAPSNENVVVVSPQQFLQLLEADTTAILLDVRSPEEFAEGHLAGAQLLNWLDREAFDKGAKALDKTKTIYVYCRSGRRSNEAANSLAGLGYKVIDMKGGYLAWTEAGLPVASERKVKISDGFSVNDLVWTRQPKDCFIGEDSIKITTAPGTDLWQRTYYHFRNDNAPVLQMMTDEKYFSFIVKTDFADSHHRFDQCGVVLYLDSENWLKGSIEYENETFQHLGSVVTNHGYSDWATTEIPASVKSMWYRLSRREDDFCIECSDDGETFRQMRVCHMHEAGGEIRFGIYACSPEKSSFTAIFTNMKLTECQWLAHDGQQPDEIQ